MEAAGPFWVLLQICAAIAEIRASGSRLMRFGGEAAGLFEIRGSELAIDVIT
ncbi:hypothetical protein M3J09_008185 [Ascochyta lentis]